MSKNKLLITAIIIIVILIATYLVFNRYSSLSNVQIPANGVVEIQSINQNAILLGQTCGKNYVNKNADFILDGTITKVNENWNAEQTSHSINAEFIVENFIKGKTLNISKIMILDIINFDKPIKTDEIISNGRPIFNEGKKTRLYLKEYQGNLNILCGVYGVEEINFR